MSILRLSLTLSIPTLWNHGRSEALGIKGNAVTLMMAFVLFTTIASVQFVYASIVNSTALKVSMKRRSRALLARHALQHLALLLPSQVDALTMGADALSFLGNLWAECLSHDSKLGRRRVELLVSRTRGKREGRAR